MRAYLDAGAASQVREAARRARSESQAAGTKASASALTAPPPAASWSFSSFLSFKSFDFCHLLLEAVYASFGVHQLLAAGEERVAAGADFHADVALVRGSCPEGVPAGADHVDFLVGGVNRGFHCSRILSKLQCSAPVKRRHSEPVKIQTPAPPEQAMRGRVRNPRLFRAGKRPVHRSSGFVH